MEESPMNSSDLEYYRCDGCGEETVTATRHLDDDNSVIATYCPGCDLQRGAAGIDPGEHPQYKLDDVLEDLARTDGGDGTGYDIVTVRRRSDGSKAIGISLDSDAPEIRDVGDYGWGELKVAGIDEIQDRVDLEKYDVGTEIATIHYDLDDWTFKLEYHVPVTRLDQLRRKIPIMGGVSCR